MSKFTHRENCIRAAAAIDCNGSISLRSIYIKCRMDTVKDDYQRWLVTEFGGILSKYKRDTKNKSPFSQRPERITWEIRNEEAVEFLRKIEPYLLTKRPQARLMIDLGEEQANVDRNLTVAEKEDLWAEYDRKMKMLNSI